MKIVKKMTLFIAVVILIVCTGFGLSSYFFVQNSVTIEINSGLVMFANELSQTVKAEVNGRLDHLNDIASILQYTENKRELLNKEAKNFGFNYLLQLDAEGIPLCPMEYP